MNCKNCNSPLEEGSIFCSNCGQKVEEVNETPFVEENSIPVADSVPVTENNISVEEPITPVVENNTSTESPLTPVMEKPIEPVINSTSYEAPKKKSNAGLIVLFIVLGVIVLGGIIFGAIKLIPSLSSKNTPVNTSKEDNTNIDSSTKTDDTVTKDETTTDYTVMGDNTLGYLKLPGTWINGKVYGASDSSLQYFTYNNGKYIITLDVVDKSIISDIKTAAVALETAYKNDSDTSNISITQTKVGKYDAYQIKVQYKSDSVWVYSYFFEAEDGIIHMIQTEGLDTSNEYFKIPNTFSLTKIN